MDYNITKNQTNIIKGLAIILIITCHIGNFFTRVTTPLGGIGVALFLMISGYGLQKSFCKCGVSFFWRKRLISVFLPYFVVQVIFHIVTRRFNLMDFILDITLIRPRFPLGWYLNYLLIWYFAFWVIHYSKVLQKKRCFWLMLFGIGISIFYFFTLSSIRFEQSFSFILGYIVSYDGGIKIGSKHYSNTNIILSFVVGFGVLLFKQNSYIRSFPYLLEVMDLIIKTSISIALLQLILLGKTNKCLIINIIGTLMAWLGTISYELYLVHGYALSFFNLISFKIEAAVCVISISIPLSILFYICNSRIQTILHKKLMCS